MFAQEVMTDVLSSLNDITGGLPFYSALHVVNAGGAELVYS
jgi:hypothetical protein